MDTYFASAKRTERRKFKNQITTISHNPLMDSLLKTSAGLLVILNEDRQIVSINHAFLDALGIEDIEDVLGCRLGETLHCIHAFERPNGCGTTQHCRTCGAAIAMMTAINDNQIEEQVCAILSDKEGNFDDTCLLIKAAPIVLDNNRWILVYAQDITQQHFWTNLERIFFHDISNILTAVYGNIQLLEAGLSENEEIKSIQTGIERLIREIQVQRTFSARKQSGLSVSNTTVTLDYIKKDLRMIVSGHRSSYEKQFIETWPEENVLLKTDILLVSRVLSNMIINAFEASKPNDTVRLTVHATEDYVDWEVWNNTSIPPDIQKRIFQRHFTTKSRFGRGLGTYSMKLFGEKYLSGKIFFTSSEEQGTVFTFRLPR